MTRWNERICRGDRDRESRFHPVLSFSLIMFRGKNVASVQAPIPLRGYPWLLDTWDVIELMLKVKEMIRCLDYRVSWKESVDPTVNCPSDRKPTSKCNPILCRIATVGDRSAAYISSFLGDHLKCLMKWHVHLLQLSYYLFANNPWSMICRCSKASMCRVSPSTIPLWLSHSTVQRLLVESVSSKHASKYGCGEKFIDDPWFHSCWPWHRAGK